MGWLREFFNTSTGKVIAAVLFLAAITLAFFVLRPALGPSEAALLSQDRVYIDLENGKTFNYRIKLGDKSRVVSPFTGKETGVEAERCYWTKDGKTKNDPTFVILNSKKNLPEPTFCPDCARLVVPLNPPATTIGSPPPTKSEYEKQRGTRGPVNWD